MSSAYIKKGLYAFPLVPLSLDTSVGIFTGWRPTGAIEHFALFSLMTAWGILAMACYFRASRHFLVMHAQEALLLFLATAISWGALETEAHFLEKRLRRNPFYHTRGAHVRHRIEPDPTQVSGILGPTYYTTGPRGFRAASPPSPQHHFQILCIGGSTTECVYLDDTKTWPEQLAYLLNRSYSSPVVWVGNTGISGFSTREHIRFLRTTNLLQDIDCLIIQPGINDLWRYLAQEEEEINYQRFVEDQTERSPSAEKQATPWKPLWTRSRVIQLYHTLQRKQPKAEMREGIGGAEYEVRRQNRQDALKRMQKRNAATKTASLPELAPGLEGYAERIRTLIQLAKKRHLPILFTTQPVLWASDLAPEWDTRCWFGWLPNGDYLSLAALRKAMDAYNQTLMQTCAESHIPCVDLSSMNGNGAFFYDDCHFTEAGAAKVAQLLAAAPCWQSWLPEPSPINPDSPSARHLE